MDFRVGLRLHFHCSCPISKPRPVLDFSLENRGTFFSKSQKMSSYGRTWCFWQFQQKIDRFPIIAICKQIFNIRAYDQFITTSLKNFVRNQSAVLVIACTLVFRSILIDTNFDERDQFSSKNTAVGLPKKRICRETGAFQKHLRPPYQSFRQGASNCAGHKPFQVIFHLLSVCPGLNYYFCVCVCPLQRAQIGSFLVREFQLAIVCHQWIKIGEDIEV